MKHVILATAICMAAPAFAACPDEIVKDVSARKDQGATYTVEIDFAAALDGRAAVKNVLQIAPSHFEVTLLPEDRTLPGAEVVEAARALADTGFERLTLRLRDLQADPQKTTQLRIRAFGLRFDCGVVAQLEATAELIDTAEEFQKEFEYRKELVEKATAYANASDQRNFYAGFAAVKGEDGNAAGAADIVINQRFYESQRKIGTLFDSAEVKLLVKKNTGANADPRNYTTGVEMTKALLFGAARKVRKREAVTKQQLSDLVERRGFPIRGLVINEFIKMEGDAFDFKTVNFVTDTQFTLPSIAKRLGSNGFWNFRILAGPEIGRSMTVPAEGVAEPGGTTGRKERDYIVRTKVGGDVTLRFLRSEVNPSKFAIEADLGYVNRFIHRAEPVLRDIVRDGQTVQERVTITKGDRPWYQVYLKMFLFGDAKVRYGLQFSWYSGSLPPSFAKARALQFGVVVETSDDQSNGEPANQ